MVASARPRIERSAHPFREATRAVDSDRGRRQLDVWSLLGLGGYNVACLFGCMALGWLVDTRLHTLPAFVLAGLGCGVVLGIVGSWLQIRKFL